MKAAVVYGGAIYTVDVIEDEGRLWLVPMWIENRERGWQKPMRMISLATIPHQVKGYRRP